MQLGRHAEALIEREAGCVLALDLQASPGGLIELRPMKQRRHQPPPKPLAAVLGAGNHGFAAQQVAVEHRIGHRHHLAVLAQRRERRRHCDRLDDVLVDLALGRRAPLHAMDPREPRLVGLALDSRRRIRLRQQRADRAVDRAAFALSLIAELVEPAIDGRIEQPWHPDDQRQIVRAEQVLEELQARPIHGGAAVQRIDRIGAPRQPIGEPRHPAVMKHIGQRRPRVEAGVLGAPG